MANAVAALPTQKTRSIDMSKNNLTRDFAKVLEASGLTITNSADVDQTPSANYSLAKSIVNSKAVLVPFLIGLALSLRDKNCKGCFSYVMEDVRDKGILLQFLDNLKNRDLIAQWQIEDSEDGINFTVEVPADEQKKRFFRSEWAELCFRYVIMRIVQQFCTSRATPLSFKSFQNVELAKTGEGQLFTELDLVVQIEKRFYVFEVKSGPWIRILQWAKRENAFVYKGSPIRNIVCTVHENIPDCIFEPQVLWSLGNIESCLREMLRKDFS